ncbi:MAG TPA: PDZ domain-containing protein [Pirellulales bacterium]
MIQDRLNVVHRLKLSVVCRALVAFCLASILPSVSLAQDLPRLEQQAMQAAVARVAPSIVRIETVGGLERIGKVLLGTGPTTGLIVSADGYIISSAFNFAQKPSSILVGLADGTRTPAKLVATDHQRMLVLLKIHVEENLPMPEAVPENEMQVGQWSIAVGRTFEGGQPNMSAGIVSGLNRIWGKAIQTDAKVSPANYGGPLVDIRGRVLGVLVPLSPQATNDLAGIEWYDSGIGFAVPLAHINTVLPKLKEGTDLKPGILGVSFNGNDLYGKQPVIASCRPNSPAYKAGLKAGDQIIEIDGQAIERQAQLRQQINRRYAGDTLKVVVLRDKERVERDIALVDQLEPFQRAFLGILPKRDAPADPAGVTVRFVYPDSPAAKAGLLTGDLITSVDGQAVANREALIERANAWELAQSVKIEANRAGEKLNLEIKPVAESAAVPAELPAAEPVAAPAGDRPQVGRIDVKLPEFKNECIAYVPESYNPQSSYGLVVWLHPPGGTKEDELLARWKEACDKQRLILLAPRSADPAKWLPPEVDFIAKMIAQIREIYNVDPQRVAIVGYQGGGSMAYALAFGHRDVAQGVAAIDAPILGKPAENEPVHRLSFFITTAKKANFADQIKAGVDGLKQMKYAVTVKDQGDAARPLNDAEFAELLRWIDSLDKM